ncbi:Sperm-associated antigen 17, partial [Nowakowskiella sp. JEL0078]
MVVVKKAIQELLKEGCKIPSYFESSEGISFASPFVARKVSKEIIVYSIHSEVNSSSPISKDQEIESDSVILKSSKCVKEEEISQEAVEMKIEANLDSQEARLVGSLEKICSSQILNEKKLNEKHRNPITFDVVGNVRMQKVHIPISVRKGKPETIPNLQHIKIESSTRRKIKTVSTSGAEEIRTFNIFPGKCDFGSIKEGGKYRTSMLLTNSSNISSRFRIKFPNQSLFRVISKHGPVAPGISTRLDIELFALTDSTDCIRNQEDSGRKYTNYFTIITEGEIITISIHA